MSFKPIYVAVAAIAAGVAAQSASASIVLATTQTSDAAFEGAGGYLQTVYGLPLIGGTALPPVERAVGQVRVSSVGVTRGLHTPNATTGIPGVGAGVTQALTNVGPIGGGSNTAFGNGTPVAFSIGRTGTTVSYTVGASTWSDTQTYYDGIDSFEIRIRSEPPSATTSADSLGLTNLSFTDALTPATPLAGFSAADGALVIKLWTGISGNFTLSGTYTGAWTGVQPTNARLASQIKLLDLPTLPTGGVPEPTTWALLVAGFGLVGGSVRRKRAAAIAA